MATKNVSLDTKVQLNGVHSSDYIYTSSLPSGLATLHQQQKLTSSSLQMNLMHPHIRGVLVARSLRESLSFFQFASTEESQST